MTDEPPSERLYELPNIRCEVNVKSEVEFAQDILRWRNFVIILLNYIRFLQLGSSFQYREGT
jgi:hypothetical protein